MRLWCGGLLLQWTPRICGRISFLHAVTPIQLLETKLFVPRSRSAVVPRPRLVERIRAGAGGKLTLALAPAGFGKTTLLSEWLSDPSAGERVVGWVSLDPSENEPPLFWAYFVRALQKVHPEFGHEALEQLISPNPPAMEVVVSRLINEISAIDADVVVVLDDYHVIESSAVHEGVALFLDRLPPRMHLVIASRSEPPLPLPRMRARGELTEVRVADLRFTQSETADFFDRVMAIELSPSDRKELERRTEGWIAALKLAALSLAGREDVREFVEGFTGDNRHVADYLVQEVLQGVSERERRFLLDTAMLGRLSGALCDAVTAEPGSQALLDDLERRNLFLIALDDKRMWYRYHHLFADVLQTHASRDDPDRLHAAHARASVWYEQNGARSEAIHHALASEDVDRAASLLELDRPPMDRSYRGQTWLSRVKSIPDAVLNSRPVLIMSYAWALLNGGELDLADARLRDVERWLAFESPEKRNDQMRVVDTKRFESLYVELDSARVYLEQCRGEIPGTVEHARQSLELIPESDLTARATGIALVALAQWGRGALEEAHDTFAIALATMRAAGEILGAIRGTFVLGDLRIEQGRLHEAARIYQRGLEVAREHIDASTAPETDELYLGLSELHRESGDLQKAEELLRSVNASSERAAHGGNRLRWCTAMARVRQAHGDLDGALALLDEAERYQVLSPLPRVRPIAALRARLWLNQRRLDDAIDWVRTRGLSTNDDLTYLREFEHVTLARVLIVQCGQDKTALRDVVTFLERLTAAASTGGRIGTAIETLILRALCLEALGDVPAAQTCLGEALVRAEPEGYLRIFVDEGSPLQDLLQQALANGIGGEYGRRVLASFEKPAPVAATHIRTPIGDTGESLTVREVEILRLIADGLRNQQIADQLFISPATVKRHIANAYGKLGVRHRTEALLRARSLHLL